MTTRAGALVIGGNYRGLCIARSLGRKGVPVWITTPPQERIACFSRYTRRTVPWINGGREEQAAYLVRLADRHRLDGWVLFPTDDESVALLSTFRPELSRWFRITTPDWNVVRWAYDKRLTYRLTATERIDYPWTLYPASEADLEAADCPFPVVLKPAIKIGANQFTVDKAWPAENRNVLLARYRQATRLVPPDLILLQEMIPGGGEAQFSFTALCSEGRTLASVTARRTRQYPIDFGHSSSFVETLDACAIDRPARQWLAAIRYTGIVEVEFKYDFRDRRYKLLDVNPRIWTWASLCARAGVDYPYLLWRMMVGEPVPEIAGLPGFRWMKVTTDVPAAFLEILRGRLSIGAYIRSLRGPLEFAVAAVDDPLPGLLDVPLFGYSSFRAKVLGASRRPTATRASRVGARPLKPL